MKESDWKIFKRVKEKALERFCATSISDIEEAIKGDIDSFHGKYIYIYRLLENADKCLSILFDDHSRSKAPLQLALLRSEGLIEEDELEGLSDELRKSTEPNDKKMPNKAN